MQVIDSVRNFMDNFYDSAYVRRLGRQIQEAESPEEAREELERIIDSDKPESIRDLASSYLTLEH